MSQLRLAYVNCSIVPRKPNKSATSTRPSFKMPASLHRSSLPRFVQKAWEVLDAKPHAAVLIEELLDRLIEETP